ncbi:MAG TPA: GNAT family N-acetyltransferase, partial [Alphaproteobacteria bacterium]|nr:GNAT family N-acetyltransferase [Alphaproteobacteria bacterium]
PSDETAALEGLRKKTRYTIRRAARFGIGVRQGFEHLPGFYAAYEARMSEKCLPFHGFPFFERMAAVLGNRAVLFVAAQGKKILGGMIFLLGADVAAYQFNATFSDALSLGVNHLLMWEAIRDFIRRGITHLDLGESRPGGGVHEFKTIQIGGKPRDVFYYDAMRRAGEPAAPGAALPLGYRLGNRIVPLLPARWRRPFLHANRRLERLL